MALDSTDRRRLRLAAIVTLLALPALWWASREEGASAPNVATVGVEIDGTAGADGAPTSEPDASNLPDLEPLGDEAPAFLDGPASEGLGVAEIAVPAPPAAEVLVATATYRSSVAGVGTCLANGVPTGLTVTVVNLNNNRRITCVTSIAPAGQRESLVLHTSTFLELADLTDAPIPVEIRQ